MIKLIRSKLVEFIKSNITLTDYSTFNKTFSEYFNTNSSNKNQVSWIYDCVDVWGKHFAGVKFRLYETVDSNPEEVMRHPINDMFVTPNQFQTWWEIKYRIAQHFAFYGNAYLYKLRNGLNLPMGLVQLLPNNLTLLMNSDGSYYYSYNTGDRMVRLAYNDVIQLRYPDPDNLFQGRAIIKNIANEVEVNQFQSAYQKEFYKQGGFLGQIFTTDQTMSNQSYERAQNMLAGRYAGGVTNSYKTGIFDQGLTPISSPYSIKDMDIVNLKDSNRDEICAAFQVNKFMFGMAESINRATAQEVTLQFTSGVIEPIMDYFDDVLTKNLAMEFGKSLYIKHDNTSPRDQDGELAWYKSMTDMGAITANEIREFEGLDIIDIEYMNYPIDLNSKNQNIKENQTVN